LIDSERLLVTSNDLRDFQKMAENRMLALLTGRPRTVAEHTLRKLMHFFNFQASVFIGDADMRPRSGTRSRIAQKPDPKSLMDVMAKLGSKRLLYVGDGAEDMIMANRAKRMGKQMLFAGIYGTAHDRSAQVRFFRRNGADFIVPTARATLCFANGQLSSHTGT
jgi:phosphoglycolate phosphatase-like HAD superfamily hydrolase